MQVNRKIAALERFTVLLVSTGECQLADVDASTFHNAHPDTWAQYYLDMSLKMVLKGGSFGALPNRWGTILRSKDTCPFERTKQCHSIWLEPPSSGGT